MGYRPDKLPRVLSDAEREAFLDAFHLRWKTPKRDYVACRLMLDLGLRVGEVTNLKPRHVKLDADPPTLRVVDGKGAKDRDLTIEDSTLYRDLERWLETREEEWPESEYLFPSANGNPVARQQLHRVVKRVADRAGLEEPHPSCHDLRHTFGTVYYQETKDLAATAKALGHAHTSTTEIYTHINGNDVAEGLAAVAARRGDGQEEPEEEERDAAEILEEIDAKMQELDRLKARYQKIAGSV